MYRAAVQHLAIFVPWESFLSETSDDINAIWERHKKLLTPRMSFLAENVQLLRRSAEDAKRDARQWAALSGESVSSVDALEPSIGEDGEGSKSIYRSDDIANATRLIDVLRSSIGADQVTAGSKEVATMVRQLSRFQEVALCSADELRATVVLEGEAGAMRRSAGLYTEAEVPGQDKVRSIKSQQRGLSREMERMIQGIQEGSYDKRSTHNAAVNSVLSGFGEQDIQVTAAADLETSKKSSGPSASVQFGPSTSFSEAGRAAGQLVHTEPKTRYRASTAMPSAGSSTPKRARYATALPNHRGRRRDWKVADHRSARRTIYKERNVTSFACDGNVRNRGGKYQRHHDPFGLQFLHRTFPPGS